MSGIWVYKDSPLEGKPYEPRFWESEFKALLLNSGSQEYGFTKLPLLELHRAQTWIGLK
jgi:hypothetical protein